MFRAVKNSSQLWKRLRRNATLSILLVLIGFISVVSFSPPAFAASEAFWQEGALIYEGEVFGGPISVRENSGLDVGNVTTYYGGTVPKNNVNVVTRILILEGNPRTATKGQVITYDFNRNDLTYSNKRDIIDITIDNSNFSQASSCNVKTIGWLICPISESIADGMDWIYEQIQGFFIVTPLKNSTESSIYNFWQIMRNIANIFFVIIIIIITLSYITGIGLTNYELKKSLPKILVASILVNLSFYLCSIAVDISNIVGLSISDMFQTIESHAVANSTASMAFSAGDVMRTVLSGAAVGTVAAGGIVIAAGGIVAALWFILGSIFIGIIIAIVALLTLAARQALIVILVMLSPLAFVFNAMPNTEKWFKKWADTFFKMLLLFPAFSFIFNGAQITGKIVVQNANGSFLVVVLGMMIQIIPLIALPMLLNAGDDYLDKFSGKLFNGAQKYKGYFDTERSLAKQEWVSSQKSPWNFAHRIAWATELAKIEQEKRAETYKNRLQAGYTDRQNTEGTSEYNTFMESQATQERVATANAISDANWNELKAELEDKIAKEIPNKGKLDLNKLKLEGKISDIELKIATNAFDKKTADSRIMMAQEYEKRAYNDLLAKEIVLSKDFHFSDGETNILDASAGVMINNNGARSILQAAMAKKRKEHEDSIKEAQELIKEYGLAFEEVQKMALGGFDLKKGKLDKSGKITKINKHGNEFTFNFKDKTMQEAAIRMHTKAGVMDPIFELYRQTNSGGTTADHRQVLSNSILENKLSDKAFFLGGKTIDIIDQKGWSPDVFRQAIYETISAGKLNAEKLATQDASSFKIVLKELQSIDKASLSKHFGAKDSKENFKEFTTAINSVLTDERLKQKLSANAKLELNKIKDLIDSGDLSQKIDSARENKTQNKK